MRRFLALGIRPFSGVMNDACGWGECAIRLDRQQCDAAPGVVGHERGAAASVHAHVAGRTAARRLLVQSGECAGRSLDREGAHRAGRLELVYGVEHPPIRVHTKEGRIRAGLYRADSQQFAGRPVHADEIDAFGTRPDVEQIRIRPRLRHLGATPRTAFPGATPSIACPFATTDTPFTITCWMPTGASDGARYVERSITVAGSKIVMSASAPTRRRPFCRIAGTRASSRCAGMSVILRMAAIRDNEFMLRRGAACCAPTVSRT